MTAFVLGWSRLVVASLLFAAATGQGSIAIDTAEVMRRFAAGASTSELVSLVRSSDAGFDLDPELVDELRAAGLPGEVLRAMRRRQAQLERQAGDREEAIENPRVLHVRINPGKTRAADRTLRIFDEIDMDLAHHWELGNDPDSYYFADVAVFVACSVPEHVPQGWRSRTPLRTDGSGVPRHRMIAFHDGAEWGRASLLNRFGMGKVDTETGEGRPPASGRADGKSGILVLPIPELLEADLVPEDRHVLYVGIALKVGDTFYPWKFARREVSEPADPLELDVRMRGLRRQDPKSLRVELPER